MKVKNMLFCFLISLIFLTNLINAQWVQTNGPFGADVFSFAINGDEIFVGTSGGVFRTTNNGESWNSVNNGLPAVRITTLSIYPNSVGGINIIAGTYGNGIFLSTNNGESWNPIFNDMNPKWVAFSSAVSPNNQGSYNIFVGGMWGMVYSSNNGLTWTTIINDYNFYTALVIAPNGNIFAGTQDNGVFLSTDNGKSWNAVNNGISNLSISSLLITPNELGSYNIFAGSGARDNLVGNGIFLSTDNGTSWTTMNNGLTNLDVTSLASKPNGKGGNIIYAGTIKFDGGGIFTSTNNGSNWTEITNGITRPMISAIDITKDGNILVGTSDGGVFLSINNGSSWNSINNGLSATSVLSLAISQNGTDIFAGTYAQGIFLSSDNGSNWTTVNYGLPSGKVTTLVINTNDAAVYAGFSGYGVYRSTNNGVSWTAVNKGLTNPFVSALAINGNNIFVGTFGGIFISNNNGSNWTASNVGLTSTEVNCFAIGNNVAGGKNIYAGTSHDGSSNGGVFLSTNDGKSWAAVNNGLKEDRFGNIDVFSLITTPNGAGGHNLLASIRGKSRIDGDAMRLFLSTDNGSTWNEVTPGLSDEFSFQVLPTYQSGSDNNFVFMCNSINEFYRSTNSGKSWTYHSDSKSYSNGIVYANSLLVGKDYIYIGTYGAGVWRRPLSEMIKTNSITYPKIALNTGSITTGQSINILGKEFKPNGSANISIFADIGFSKSVNNINIDAKGSFNYNFAITTEMKEGIYSIQVTDNVTGFTTAISSFTLKSNSVQSTYLNIISPAETFTVDANASFLVEWKDKMITGSNYPLTGSQRNYKYKIELSSDNGSKWNLLGEVEGTELINNWVMLHYFPSISTPGNGYKIRITDFYKSSNTQSTPAFIVSSTTNTGNLIVSLDWDDSYPKPTSPVAGVAADGTARIFLNLYKKNNNAGSNITSVSVTLSDAFNGTDPIKLGRVKVATEINYSLEANGINSITDVDNTPNKSNYIYWYVAPDDFAGADPEDIKSSARFVTATFTINYANSTSEIKTKKIKIVRPPLALVHGLASDPSAWNNFTFTLPNGLPIKYLSSLNYLFYKVSAIPIIPIAHFTANAFRLIDASNSQTIANTLQGVINDMRNKGYAANQVDYVCHSMGGNVIRQTVNLFSNAYKVTENFTNSPYKNYENGFVHKIITLNTPNNGSPWGDLVTKFTPLIWEKALLPIYTLFQSKLSGFIQPDGNNKFEATDAVKDLEINDPGVNMQETNIPTHLIAGNMFGEHTFIDEVVWVTINYIPYFTEFVNLYWEVLRAYETDETIKAQLNTFMGIGSNDERAVKFYNYYASTYFGLPNFLLNGDLIVSLESQLAGLSSSAQNKSVYNGWYTNHTLVTQDLEVGDRVYQLINSPVNGPLFNTIPATNNAFSKSVSIKSPGTIISKIDTNKIKILSPANFSNYTVDSVILIKIQIKDTSSLKYVKLTCQGENYINTSLNSFIDFNLPVNSEFLEKQQIVATAVYDVTDTTKFLSDTVNVNVAINEPIQDFTISQEIFPILKNQTIYPDYYATYQTFVTKISNNNSKLNVTINDPNVVTFDAVTHGFIGKNHGDTFVIVDYKGLKDTIYFSINGEITTGISLEDSIKSNSRIPDNYLLFQNYPNPFNATTTIKYSIPKASLVKIQIYDILGREVTTLVNEEKLAGNYSILFNGSNLASGVYLYRIYAGDFIQTNKLVLLK